MLACFSQAPPTCKRLQVAILASTYSPRVRAYMKRLNTRLSYT